MKRKVTEVACGVLINSKTHQFLLGSRPEGKPCAGFWEFPGGKLEIGESVHDALFRELNEELGIQIGKSYPWFVLEHDYPHAYVRLHFRRCFDWQGEPRSLEHQKFAWFDGVSSLGGLQLLPMDALVSERIFLPDIVLTHAPDELQAFTGLDATRGVFVQDALQMKRAAEAGFLYAVVCQGFERAFCDQRNELPFYVFGKPLDLEAARECGAHGVVVVTT